jgi:predicted lipoprotein with Yx(FWY)xxD motif
MATRKTPDPGRSRAARRTSGGPASRRTLLVAPAAAAAAASALAACGSSGTSATAPASASASAVPSSTAAAAGVKTAKVGGATVLTSTKGFTLYSFAPDTSTKSVCNGGCATAWPPVKPATASGVKAPFATIKRSDGATQLTFHGHPLYTFAGDTSPGQASGNGVNQFGGLWHEAPASGSAAPASGSSSGSGGGYSY